MGTFTAKNAIDRAAALLYDQTNIKWSRADLLTYVNDGQRAIVSVVPESTGTTTVVITAAGSKQTVPADGWMLLEVVRNMGTDGGTPGRSVKNVDRAILDETNPTWYSTPTATTQTVYMYNLRDRMTYYVYPPATGTNYLEIVYSKIPVDMTENTAITIADVYLPALVDYALFRAYSKNAEFADPARASAAFQSFAALLATTSGSQAKLAQQMDQILVPTQQTQGSFSGGGQ